MNRYPLPKWMEVCILPVLNLTLALLIAGVVIGIIGQDPWVALKTMLYGAFGYGEGLGYTLHFATNFVFTGLAVAIAAQAGLFNIGAEGQAYVAGLGAILVGLSLDGTSWMLALPLAVVASCVLGAVWAFIPGYLQAKRGSHVVVTTIMFNFLASALMVYIVSRFLKPVGQMEPSSATVQGAGVIPALGSFFPFFGYAPLNLCAFLAVIALIGFYVLVWHTRFGFTLRAVGQNREATRYAGMATSRIVMIVMAISGALSGLVAVNEVLGVQQRLVLDFPSGYGFVGVAVALMGRNNPVGILLSAILFGALYQGGLELQFTMPAITRDMIVVIQALIILFTGAMEGLLRPVLECVVYAMRPQKTSDQLTANSRAKA